MIHFLFYIATLLKLNGNIDLYVFLSTIYVRYFAAQSPDLLVVENVVLVALLFGSLCFLCCYLI